MKKVSVLCVFFLSLFLMGNAARIYVKPGAGIHTPNGTSWGSAFWDLQQAINNAVMGDEIWVAKGSISPMVPASDYWLSNGMTAFLSAAPCSFVINKNIKIYGGFAGTESSLSERNPATNITTLVARRDQFNSTSYHVVIFTGNAGGAILDGFTIKNGNASSTGSMTVDGYVINSNSGGGIYIVNSSPKLQYLNIINNQATYGAAIYSTNAQYKLENVFINGSSTNNSIIHHTGSSATLTITNVSICGNNCNNSYVIDNTSGSPVYILNSVLWNNNVSYHTYGSSTYMYSCIENTQPFIYPGTYTTTPCFIEPTNNNYRLSTSSPLKNAGNNSYCSLPYDLDWKPRTDGDKIDIGAYEYQSKSSISPMPSSERVSLTEEYIRLKSPEVYPSSISAGQPISVSLGDYSKPVYVELYSLNGKLVHTKTYEGGGFEISTPDLVPGMYILNIHTQGGESFSNKIIVNK